MITRLIKSKIVIKSIFDCKSKELIPSRTIEECEHKFWKSYFWFFDLISYILQDNRKSISFACHQTFLLPYHKPKMCILYMYVLAKCQRFAKSKMLWRMKHLPTFEWKILNTCLMYLYLFLYLLHFPFSGIGR